MVLQNMEGITESEQLASLTGDQFFSDICEKACVSILFFY